MGRTVLRHGTAFQKPSPSVQMESAPQRACFPFGRQAGVGEGELSTTGWQWCLCGFSKVGVAVVVLVQLQDEVA